jgi:hypothetical protein
VVSVLATEPTEDDGFLWVIKIPSAHFLWRGSKAVVDLRHVKEPMSEILCRPNFLTCFSPVSLPDGSGC